MLRDIRLNIYQLRDDPNLAFIEPEGLPTPTVRKQRIVTFGQLCRDRDMECVGFDDRRNRWVFRMGAGTVKVEYYLTGEAAIGLGDYHETCNLLDAIREGLLRQLDDAMRYDDSL